MSLDPVSTVHGNWGSSVVDVEATCWDGPPPPAETSEIIEIGVCPLVTSTGERLPKESILVKPRWSQVSPFCTQLTTLTQKDVDGGVQFKEAVDRVREVYKTRFRTFASWGDYDRRQFERQCQVDGIPYPFGPTHWACCGLPTFGTPFPSSVK